MPANIPFSLGLEGLSADILALSGQTPLNGNLGAGPSATGVSNIFNNSGGAGAFGGADVGLGSVTTDGYFNADNSVKQIVCPMTLFQSFPVETGDGSYTRVTDYTSTKDGAGTDLGNCVQNLNGGRCGYPDNATASVLDMQANGGVENFKVGAAIALPYIEEWFKRFFPEVTFKASRKYSDSYGGAYTGGSMYKLIANGCLCAEVVFPTSNTTGKAIRIKVVSFAPMHEGPRFDIMPAFCLAKGNAEVFKITAISKGRNTVVDGSNLKFMFQDCPYDWTKGEVIGYGPKQLKEKLFGANGKSFDQSKVWRQFTGGTVGGPTGDNGFSIVRVRFLIEPGHKEKAEQILGCSIPEELMKANYAEGNIQLSELTTAAPTLNVDSSGIAGAIINAGIRVGTYCHQNGFVYSWQGRSLAAAPAGSGLKIAAKSSTDCSAGTWWILGEAGLLKNPTGWPPNTTFFRKNFSDKLIDGYSVIEVGLEQLQPGDIILWDRGKSQGNHIAIYASPGKCFDFGSTKRIKSMQPVTKGLNDKSAIAGRKFWRVVPAGTAQMAVNSEHKTGVKSSGSFSQSDMSALN